MSNLDTLLNDLVIANRILANEDIVDAYGHVSIRHPDKPDRFFLARSLAPEFITRDYILEFDLDCNVIDAKGKIARVWRKVRVPGHAEEVLEAAKALSP